MGKFFESVGLDLKWGVRALAARPLYALTAVLTLALGLGLTSTVFSLLNGALLRPLPFRDSGRLMQIVLRVPANQFFPGQAPRDMVWSYPKFETFRDAQEIFEAVSLYRETQFNVTGLGDPRELRGELVGPGFHDILRIEPVLGRPFLGEEEAEGRPVVLIGNRLWRESFGADADVLQRSLRLDAIPHQIVGVLPAGFRGLTGSAQLWVPLQRLGGEILNQPLSHSFSLVARLKPGVSAEQAEAEIRRLGRLVDAAYQSEDREGREPWSAAGHFLEEIRADRGIKRTIWLLFAAVDFFLLLVCVNLAGLAMARTLGRSREVAIRAALGAARRRLIRQLVTENLVIGVCGGALGLLFAAWGSAALARLAPQTAEVLGSSLQPLTAIGFHMIEVDGRVLLFALGATLLTVLVFGLLPAVKVSALDVNRSLRAGGASGRSLTRWRRLLVAGEVALALVLVMGAGLALRSLGRLNAVEVGIDPEDVLTLRVKLPREQYDGPRARRFFQELQQEVAALPGVERVGFNNCPPLSGGCNETVAAFPDRPTRKEGQEPPIEIHYTGGDYFQALRIPLLRGELFHSPDPDGAKLVVINQTAAREFWPGEDPIGRPIRLYSGGFHTGTPRVVGVVADVRYEGLIQPQKPSAYVPVDQSPRPWGYLFVRSAAGTELVPAVRQVMRSLDPDLPLTQVMMMEERVRAAAGRTRFLSRALGLFAALALGLSALGLYGVMAQLVTQRTREIGLRQALGAKGWDIRLHVLRQTLAPVLTGVWLGTVAALWLNRWFAAELHQVEWYDPWTLAAAPGVILLTGLAAGSIPARRAARLEPMQALRYE